MMKFLRFEITDVNTKYSIAGSQACLHLTQIWEKLNFNFCNLELWMFKNNKDIYFFLDAFRKISKSEYERHVCLSVCPYPRNNSAPTGRIFIKFVF